MSGIIGVSPNMRSGVLGAVSRGQWQLLQEKETVDVSNSEIDLGNATSGGHVTGDGTPFCSAYRDYKIVGSEVAVSPGAEIRFRWSVGSLLTSGYKTVAHGVDSGGTARDSNHTNSDYAYMTASGIVQAGSTGAYGGINFEMYLNRAAETNRTVVYGHSAYRQDNHSGQVQYTSFAANQEGSGGAIGYVRIYASTSIRTAKISLYGLAL
jgi:hypothetical protein